MSAAPQGDEMTGSRLRGRPGRPWPMTLALLALLTLLTGSACGGGSRGGEANPGSTSPAEWSPSGPSASDPSAPDASAADASAAGTAAPGTAASDASAADASASGTAASGAAPAAPAGRLTATIDALGPARIGDPGSAFARALGRRLQPLPRQDQGGGGTDCWVRTLVGLKGVTLTARGPKDDQPVSMVRVTTRAVRMSNGVGVGSTETEIRAAYPRAVRSEPNKYTPGAVDLSVRSGPHKVLFEVDPAHRVTSFRFGAPEQVELVEGCS